MADLVFRHAGSSDGARIAIGPHAESRADQSVYRRTSPKHIACERRGPSPGRRHTPAMRRLSIIQLLKVRRKLAAGAGIEPALTDPKSVVLPLDDPALINAECGRSDFEKRFRTHHTGLRAPQKTPMPVEKWCSLRSCECNKRTTFRSQSICFLPFEAIIAARSIKNTPKPKTSHAAAGSAPIRKARPGKSCSKRAPRQHKSPVQSKLLVMKKVSLRKCAHPGSGRYCAIRAHV